MGSSDIAQGLQWLSPPLRTSPRAHSGPGDSGSQCPVPLLASASTVAPLWLCSSHTGLLMFPESAGTLPLRPFAHPTFFPEGSSPRCLHTCTFTPCRALLKPHLLGERSPATICKTLAPHFPSILPPAVSPYSA